MDGGEAPVEVLLPGVGVEAALGEVDVDVNGAVLLHALQTPKQTANPTGDVLKVLKVLKGPKGPKGPKYPKGPKDPKDPKGPKGPKGPKDPKDPKGPKGPKRS